MPRQNNKRALKRERRQQRAQHQQAAKQQNTQSMGAAAKNRQGKAHAANRGNAANRQQKPQQMGAAANRGAAQRQQAPLPTGVTARRNVYFIVGQVPVNGAGGTAAGKALPGILCVNSTTGSIYVNIGTLNEPNWQAVAAATPDNAPAATQTTAPTADSDTN